MLYSDFDAEVFRNDVREALTSVQRVLDTDRGSGILLAEDVDHGYTEKYELANVLTNVAILSLLAVLEKLGLTRDLLRDIAGENKNKKAATTLRFAASESCKFVKGEVVDVKYPVSKETKESTNVVSEFGASESTTTKSKSETIVHRFYKEDYTIEANWELSIYSGTDVENRRVISSRTGATCDFSRKRLYVSDEDPDEPLPFPLRRESDPQEVSLTWLLQQIEVKEEGPVKSHFAIDVSPNKNKSKNSHTKTPSRNPQIDQAKKFFFSVQRWVHNVGTRFLRGYQKYQRVDDLEATLRHRDDTIFVPILPLLVEKREQGEGGFRNEVLSSVASNDAIESESDSFVSLPPTQDSDNQEGGDVAVSPSSMLSVEDTTRFLDEEARTLSEMERKLRTEFPDRKLISSAEAMVFVFCRHVGQVLDRYHQSIQYIEFMLEEQLVAAIGKKVSSDDLDKFMRHHNQKILNPSPNPFCHTIRRPEHYPDGILSIEENGEDASSDKMEPISTHVREISVTDTTEIPLNAATTLELTGKTYLHGWLKHRFGDHVAPSDSIRLNARARQFSSFVLLVGTMTSQNRMVPKDAIILRNKDEVHIPLLLNEIPTATEFKDAIGSLSPEQQRFAKAFRSMQLESSILGVCVVQIKPQLEKLLGLPQDSLTKEMKLTEDLTELFVEYQIPSDLVSYNGGDCIEAAANDDNEKKTNNHPVAHVKRHVQAVLDVIAAQKKEQLEEQAMKTKMAVAEGVESSFPQAPMPGSFPGEARIMRRNDGKLVPRVRKYGKARSLRPLQQKPTPAAPIPQMYQNDHGATAPLGMAMEAQCGPDSDNYMLTSDYSRNVEDTKPAALVETSTAGFAAIPKVLDRAIEKHDKNAAIRSTTIETDGAGWTRKRQKNLLTKPRKETLAKDEIESEKSKAFDLLDALSRSGSLVIPFSELHIVICATHRFEKNVMETVIQDNINPIEKLEMSTLLMASTILNMPARDLVRKPEDIERLEASFPLLLEAGDNAPDSVSPATSVEI
eukprot:CAMPEP_0201150568 /NCGR_PEP_ID=MMETSP0851-20130426/11673_1 /ASSEMBLY_ACC=CAM_ASM_000631 /TAXON_ID=183588 /ORGANISM="Pseudo-nitzschia fraudulenta, Strain WWA7" /LENGTH=1014 /DNA_ID=CAMNT_0047427253 /DNA_START=66 /DNA_END=3110 /DNA_ORIENTATION=-